MYSYVIQVTDVAFSSVIRFTVRTFTLSGNNLVKNDGVNYRETGLEKLFLSRQSLVNARYFTLEVNVSDQGLEIPHSVF